jgi:hypothetical protein
VNDIDDVLIQARDSVSARRITSPPPVEAILARSRDQRHRRRLAGASVAGIAGVAVLALGLGLAGGFGGHSPARAGTTIRTAAFTLAENANGTATLTLSQDQVFNPTALQQALQQDGIPALVETGSYCSSNPSPPGWRDVLSLQLPDGTTVGPDGAVPSDAVTVINPAAMPAGAELFFGYFNNSTALMSGLLYTNSYTCSSTPPTGG